MAYRLVVTKGPLRGRTFLVVKTETKLGRDPANDIVLDDDYVSRLHATIATRGDDHLVVNASPNGTLVNGKRVERAKLKSGDEITLGAATVLRYEPEAGAVAKPTPEKEEPTPATTRVLAKPKPLLLRRPKILAAGLAYLAVLIALGVFLATRGKKDTLATIPYLTEEQVRRDLEREVERDRDPLLGKRRLEEAMDLYGDWRVDPGNLYRAITAFKEAEAYLGRRLREQKHIRARQKAIQELEKIIMDLYFKAFALQEEERYDEARDRYDDILQYIDYDSRTETFQNVTRRMKALEPLLERKRWIGR